MGYEYKCVGAPERAKRRRGAKTRSDRVAAAMQDVIAAESKDGWEYQRTDLIPMEEKAGLLSRSHEVHRAVLVFRRALAGAQPVAAPVAAPAATPEPMAPEPSVKTKEPELAPEPAPEAPEEPIRLAADRNEGTGGGRKPPKGLG